MTTDDRERLTRQLKGLAVQRARARREYDATTERIRDVVVALVAAGMPELTAAQQAGVSRRTVRIWVGKDTWRGAKASK